MDHHDRVAVAVLYGAHHAHVRWLAHRAGVRDADQADAVQCVFVALAEAIGRGLDVSPPLEPWLRVTTFRIARGYLRAREEPSVDGAIDVIDSHPTPEEAMETQDLRKALDEVLGELAPERRQVLLMSDRDDMTMPEIAETLELPVDTGYTRLRLARRDFEAAWRARVAIHVHGETRGPAHVSHRPATGRAPAP